MSSGSWPGPEAIPKATNGRLVVVGDTQRVLLIERLFSASNDARQAELAAEIAARAPDAIVHVGDMVALGSARRHWKHFARTFAPLATAAIPIAPVMGNHDYMGLSKRRARRRAGAAFPSLAGPTWYSWRYDELAFIALDSNTGALGRPTGAEQLSWLEATVARLEADGSVETVVAYWHHPVFTNSRIVRASRSVREHFVPRLLQTQKLAAVFSGHAHAYERFVHAGRHFVVTGGGGGPLHPLRVGRRQSAPDQWSGRVGARGFMHFCELQRTTRGWHVEVVRTDDGPPTIVDRFPLRPARGSEPAR